MFPIKQSIKVLLGARLTTVTARSGAIEVSNSVSPCEKIVSSIHDKYLSVSQHSGVISSE
jgi:hypothetical protein